MAEEASSDRAWHEKESTGVQDCPESGLSYMDLGSGETSAAILKVLVPRLPEFWPAEDPVWIIQVSNFNTHKVRGLPNDLLAL